MSDRLPMRRTLTSLAAAGMAVAVLPVAAAPTAVAASTTLLQPRASSTEPAAAVDALPRYRLTDLGALDGPPAGSWATDVNDSGKVVGASAGRPYRAFMWESGATQPTSLHPRLQDRFGPQYSSYGIGVGSDGTVIGNAMPVQPAELGWPAPFVMRGETIERLPDGRTAQDVNGTGSVVGTALNAGHDQYSMGGVWVDGALRRIPRGIPNAVNDHGQVAGSYKPTNDLSEGNASVWCGSRRIDLSGPDGSSSAVTALSPAGIAAGWSEPFGDGEADEVAHLWRDGDRVDIGALGEPFLRTYPSGVNDAGLVVGESLAGYAPGSYTTGWIWNGHGIVEFDQLLDGAPDWHIWSASAINASGVVAAVGQRDRQFHAVLLTPTTSIEGPELPPGSAQPGCAGVTDTAVTPPASRPGPVTDLRAPTIAAGGGEWARLSWTLPPDAVATVITNDRGTDTPRGPTPAFSQETYRGSDTAVDMWFGNNEEHGWLTLWAIDQYGHTGPPVSVRRPARPSHLPALAREADDSCPAGRVPPESFDDVAADDAHGPAVSCAAWWKVTSGRTTTAYDPSGEVSRGQIASFLARLLERSGATLPPSPRDAYTDDSGSVHERAINQLAALGILHGDGQRRYSPDVSLTRAQLAALLVRSYEMRAQYTLVQPWMIRDWFRDDQGDTHERAINIAAAAGFAAGVTGTEFNGNGRLRRDQTASLLVRALDLLVEAGVTTPPDR